MRYTELLKSPWNRAAIVLTAIWILVASATYASNIGTHYGEAIDIYEQLPALLRWWAIVCARVGQCIYGLHTPEHALGTSSTSLVVYFDLMGYLLYIGGPATIILLATLGSKWVLQAAK